MTRNTVAPSKMTSAERSDLRSLIRQRARLMKAHVAQRGLELMAEFEAQLQTYFSYNQDEVWAAAYAEAEKIAQESNTRVAQRCKELGIPEKFAPSLSFGWRGQGENASAKQHAALRREARAHVASMEAAAKTEIERVSVDSQTELISDALTSEAAKAFLDHMPSAETLMPIIELKQVQGVLEQGER